MQNIEVQTSVVMAKRSQRRLSRSERDQASCIWGLISIFRFRHGRSTRRLLGNRMRASKQCVVAPSNTRRILSGHTEKSEVVSDVEEKKMAMAVVAKTSVKELMEEEMFNEQGSKKQSNVSDMGFEQKDSRKGSPIKKNFGRKNKAFSSYSGTMELSKLDAEICLIPEDEAHLQKESDILDLEMTMEELAAWINQRNTQGMNRDSCSEPGSPTGQAVVVGENIIAAIKAFVEQRLNDCINLGEEGKSSCSKELLDTFSSNKGLFLKLLHDPNSALVRHIQNLEVARFKKDQKLGSVTGSHLSEEKPTNLKDDGFSSRRQHNFFRRRSKSLDSFTSERDEKIAISRPGSKGIQSPDTATRYSPHSPCDVVNNEHSERNKSQFSFTEIKRKLRNAMGKERYGISHDGIIHKSSSKQQNGNNNEDKSRVVENFGWSSPNRNHFYSERFANPSTIHKKGEQPSKSRDNGLQLVKETCQYPILGESNIYIEAKKHLCEMLNNGDVNAESTSRQLPKSLGGILCLPEYNSSPFCSPRKHVDDIFITAQMRLSPRGIVKNNVSGLAQENHITQASPDRQNPENMSYPLNDKVQSSNTNIYVPCREDHENSSEVQSCREHIIVLEVPSCSSKLSGIEEMAESRPDGAREIISISSESSSNATQVDVQNGDIQEVDSEESFSQFLKDSNQGLKSDLFRQDQIPSSPELPPVHSPGAVEAKDSEDAINSTDRASPISVLEPLFTDDDISPASTSQPVRKEIEPRQIHFEEQSYASEQGTCMRISLEDEESAFEYVEAVLLGSGLNWDEFLLRWLSLIEILDPSLFDDVELFSSRPRHDQKLLFDCSNEVLKEVCEAHFGCLTGISSVSHNIMPVPMGMDLINEVWKRVEWHLFQPPVPHSLDQLVKTDMGKCAKWPNIRSDIGLTGYDMGENIFDELVEDTVLAFVSDTTLDAGFMILSENVTDLFSSHLERAAWCGEAFGRNAD